MNRYYITEKNEKQFNASNKAREDIEACFKQSGYKQYMMYSNILNSKNPRLTILKELALGIINLKYKDCLYIQYPYYKHSNKINFLIKLFKKIKKLDLICIVHDIDCLRYKNDNMIKKEIKFFNICKFVVSHNENMSKWLIDNGCTSKIINIEVFDYLLTSNKKINNNRNTDIVFAGNLDKNKSEFIYKLIEQSNINFTVNLYGSNFDNKMNNEKIKYCGKYSPEELVEVVEGKFGLIWDGKELDCCSGDTGEYTKYNNPHKLSLYIASELPVICWDKMAISKFVKQNKIGLCVSSLDELNNIDIKSEDYDILLKNVINIKNRITNGKYIKSVLEQIDGS